MRELVERSIEDGHVVHHGPARKSGRRITVNLAESPLSWLRARGLVDARQFDAGERLRADYETAALGPRVTMRWDAAPAGPRGGRAHDGLDPTTAQIAAKRRFDAAVAAAGPGLADILWRVICAGETVPVAEKALGWPARAGRLVLTLALDRVAAHYGMQ
ncbi:DUF6456 domain-containing protein [Sphingomonas sp. BT-65]|uniref:DUF6456 domain-containing protein n=1 Tax=Sphingomonas sp. BT-65 TaxID=2989821 RepID=UPI0022354422|nr:DUF6456 domain-containing protein [Sphingomonas sp. BT-65]MCW4462230.1 DUF6456 domain-containing protein [Sphingomonas sp. BT-65]